MKALTIEVGTRRPLIVSAGGVAILLALPKDEARAIKARNLKQLARFGDARIRSLERMLRRSESRGFGISQADLVPGVSAFGVAICDVDGAPFASLSIVGRADEFPSSRVPHIIEALQEEARTIARLNVEVFAGAGST
jgi:DNA-binding IclR family transcriptional regulator